MGILEEYENFLNKYTVTYGNKTRLLYQNGAFYEFYGVDNEHEKIGHVKEMSRLLGIQLTRRTKAITENNRNNFLQAGFPLNQLDRYVAILTEDYSYVCVIVEQIPGTSDPIQRQVTNIIGPGTNIKYLLNPQSSYLLSIYLEQEKPKTKLGIGKSINLLTIGLSAIDLSTGQSLIYEVGNTMEDENRAIDETYRLIQTLNPKEIIINTRNIEETQYPISKLIQQWDLESRLVHCDYNKINSDHYNLTYQNQFLSKIYKNTGILTPIEYLNLERYPTTLISFLMALNFCYGQNENLINEISVPLIFHNQNHLILDNNALNQLNLISTQGNNLKTGSVCSLMDQTSTPMGRRLLKEKILMPILNPIELQLRYDYMETLRTVIPNPPTVKLKLPGHASFYKYQLYEPHLNQILDIERYQRKLTLLLLQPCEFIQLDQSYRQIQTILDLLKQDPKLQTLIINGELLTQSLKSYIDYYESILDLQEIAKYNFNNISGSFFKPGYSPEIDSLQLEIDEVNDYFEQLGQTISQLVSKSNDNVCNHESTEMHGHCLAMTTARYQTFKMRYQEPMIIKTTQNPKGYLVSLEDLEIIKNSNGKNCKLYSSQIRIMSRKLIEASDSLIKKTIEVYKKFLTEIYQKHGLVMKQITQLIATLDFYKSNAKTSLLFNYCRPELDLDQGPSYVQITAMRHPLIERFQDIGTYVPQDIHLDGDQRGILLYGPNCVGKSSCMKSVGICAILAQAGLYVPATKFKFRPYHTLLTRILGNDNLFKGQSSFAIEMTELRGILKRSNPQSLVLGDEICRGTESISGASIMAAAIIQLNQVNCNYLFATHIHELSQMDRIKNIENLKMYHLKVKFDENTGNLIYHRKLEKGCGLSIYGLEVAKGMGFDRSFIDLANDIRKEIMGISEEILPANKSRYNTSVYLDQCGIPECSRSAVDTHHILFQSHANSEGFIGHIHKNHKTNLVPLCKECHMMVHNDEPLAWRYHIYGYVQTLEGLKLQYEKIQNSIHSKKAQINNNCRCDSLVGDSVSQTRDSVSQTRDSVSETTDKLLETHEFPKTKKKLSLSKNYLNSKFS